MVSTYAHEPNGLPPNGRDPIMPSARLDELAIAETASKFLLFKIKLKTMVIRARIDKSPGNGLKMSKTYIGVNDWQSQKNAVARASANVAAKSVRKESF